LSSPLDVLPSASANFQTKKPMRAVSPATARPTIPPVPSVLLPPITTTAVAAAELDADEDGEEGVRG
jgi:hypothetical protein